MKIYLLPTLLSLLTASVTAAPVDLDFSNYVTGTSAGDTGGMRYTGVATVGATTVNVGINALTSYSFTTLNANAGQGPGSNVGNNIRLNMERDTQTTFRINFYDAGIGDGFTNLVSATGLEFDLMFYDLDGDLDSGGVDRVTFLTPGIAEYASVNDMIISNNETTFEGSQTYNGNPGGGNVVNPTATDTTLTADQQEVAVKVSYTGQNFVDFIYEIPANIPPTTVNNRSMFISGSDFDITVPSNTVVVPEISSLMLAGIAFVGLTVLTRRKK